MVKADTQVNLKKFLTLTHDTSNRISEANLDFDTNIVKVVSKDGTTLNLTYSEFLQKYDPNSNKVIYDDQISFMINREVSLNGETKNSIT